MTLIRDSLIAAAAMAALASMAATPESVVVQPARTTGVRMDYANAKPMPLPRVTTAPGSRESRPAGTPGPRKPGSWPAQAGDGTLAPVQLASPKAAGRFEPAKGDAGGVQPEDFGSSKQVFTTSRAGIEQLRPERGFPFSAVGRMFLTSDFGTSWCSASMIQPGLLLTAAHCVASFGENRFYADIEFVPAYSSGRAPFGTWMADRVLVTPAYFNGTSLCSVSGVVCEDDMAIVILKDKGGRFVGQATGWLGVAWDGEGFNASNEALITQFGYPGGLDQGEIMQRTDSQGFTSAVDTDNTVIGSFMDGGSSGGPWVVDWGIAPDASRFLGKQAPRNRVVGVTSWGYVFPTIKQQGAAPFLSTNIVPLAQAACNARPAACIERN